MGNALVGSSDHCLRCRGWKDEHRFWAVSGIDRREEPFERLQATPAGLTTDEAGERLSLYGPNSLVEQWRFAQFSVFSRFFALSSRHHPCCYQNVSLVLGEHVAGLIVIARAMLSVLLNFLMDFQARHAVEEPRKQAGTA